MAIIDPGSTFQFEDRKGRFWEQHSVDAHLVADDGHRYYYGKVTSPRGAIYYDYAMHASGCHCVLLRLSAELEAMRSPGAAS